MRGKRGGERGCESMGAVGTQVLLGRKRRVRENVPASNARETETAESATAAGPIEH
jgi:hypothetical protein